MKEPIVLCVCEKRGDPEEEKAVLDLLGVRGGGELCSSAFV